jgi:signal transduction histidine kinase
MKRLDELAAVSSAEDSRNLGGTAPGWRRLPHPVVSLPPMRVVSLLLVGRDPSARAIALGAARLAYPGAGVVEVTGGVAEAEKREQLPQAEILVLLRPTAAEVERATHARSPRGLPRWPVVVFGESRAGGAVQIVPPEDWSPSLGAQALACAAAQHELVCDNERLRGDLRSMGRRINHDLRTPLNCISTAGEGMREFLPDPASPQTALTQSLLGAVEEVVTLIERVSFVLRATADPLPRQPLSMREAVWAALQRFDSRIRRQGANVVLPPSWPKVEGVAPWLEVIWGNLLGNALRYGGPAPCLELGWVQEGAEHRFWIRDQGPGVDAERRAQLFEPFDRLHELHAPRGLGLSIVQRLVELQGGRCGYESPPGGGALFFFTLPTA